jgi:DegV family protein with EDD domain
MMMAKIKIVTDSTADIPPALLKKYDISFIPLKVCFGERTYLEDVDLEPMEFYKKLVTFNGLPSTSQPSPGEFYEFYKALTEDGASVISIHISSLMSGTSQSARIATSLLPDREITVVDSKLVSFALGIVVIAAAKAAKMGKSKAEIMKLIETMIENVHTYFVVDTLDYLERNGRIGKAVSLLGTMLNLKPILTFEDGLIAPYEKVRGKGKALEQIIKIAKKHSQEHGELCCFVFHANVFEQAVKFKQKVKQDLNCEEIMIGDIGAVVGTHAGPGIMALFFYDKKFEVS